MRFILFFFILFCSSVYAQQPKQKTVNLLDSPRTQLLREKLYIHFDRTTYALSDTIWFKGYLTEASMHAASPLSGLIYTELIHSGTGEVIQELSLPTALGLTWGSFVLNPEKHKPGNYTFRAYTNWMQNFGDAYFFKKEITIVNLLNEEIQIAKKKDTSSKQQLKNIDIQFLPEGGAFMPNMPQRVAFKAINANGKGIVVNGEIIDSKRLKVVEFQSNALGMGYFNILPSTNENYTAIVRYGSLTKEVDLPKPQQNSTVLQVSNHIARIR